MIFNPFSKIFMHMENSGWVLTREAEAVKNIKTNKHTAYKYTS